VPVRRKRAALCFSGQMRSVERTYEEFYKRTLFEPNEHWDIDVFVHTWFDVVELGKVYEVGGHKAPGSVIATDTVDRLFKIYNPTKALLERQIAFSEEMGGRRDAHIPAIYTTSKLYSMKASNLLKRKFEQERGFKYDLVMQLRFDVGIFTESCFDTFNPMAYTCSDHAFPEIDVAFGFMGSDISDVFMVLYDSYEDYWRNQGVKFIDEALGFHHCKSNRIPIVRSPEYHGYTLVR
jgi:hypothetical protein